MLFDHEPANWRELQRLTHQLFNEIGCEAFIEKKIETVRGFITIDVYVEDHVATHPLIYLCECKYWERSIPQTIVHSFRTVVHDSGAHRGYIISKAGFQRGAIKAAQHSNVDLVTWHQLQAIFENRWLNEVRNRIISIVEQLTYDYTEEDHHDLINLTQEEKTDYFIRLLFQTGCIMAGFPYLKESEKKSFPWTLTDPSSDPFNKSLIQINSLRELYNILIPTAERILADYRYLMALERNP